jgi:sRNA-binding protein
MANENESVEDSNQGPAQAAIQELEKAEAHLQHARAEELVVEREIAEAAESIERIEEELGRESRIKVNGRTRTIEGHKASYEEVVKLAFPSGPSKPNTKFTVTYRNAASVPAMGELDPGQSVRVKPGCTPLDETIFNVTETVLS